ncbi:zinc ribbon domain-containing protein [Ruminococcaceae bacterium OttesenSCG-928-L11]|nr:zinc ribbon domain-containing protein [Ruminococcaceae bacterium OttesenSCG-928-L11]
MECGHPLEISHTAGEDGKHAGFCDHCGTAVRSDSPAKYCACCGAALPEGRSYCLLCGTPAGQAPAPPIQAEVPADTASFFPLTGRWPRSSFPTSVAAERKRLTGMATWIVALLFAGIAALALWWYLPYLTPSEALPVSDAVVYTKSGGGLYLFFPEKEPIELSASYPAGSPDPTVMASADGRYLAYLNSSGGNTLHYLDLSRMFKLEIQPREGHIVDTNVESDFRFATKGGTLAFRSGDGLFLYRNRKIVQLDTGVTGIVDVGERQILYTKAGADEPYVDLYLRSLDADADDKTLIAAGVAQLLDHTASYGAFLLLMPQTDAAAYEVLYHDARTAQTQTLASGVTSVLDASAEKKTFVYVKESAFVPAYTDLVSDPHEATDSRLTAPDPDYFDLPEGFVEYMEGLADEEMPVEDYELDDEVYDSYTAYREAQDKYADKLERDRQRRRIRAGLDSYNASGQREYSLFVYRNNSARAVEEGLLFLNPQGRTLSARDAIDADIAGNSIVYVMSSSQELPVLSLDIWAELQNDVRAYFKRFVPQHLCYATLDGEPVTMQYTDSHARIRGVSLSAKGDGLYYVLDTDNDAELSGRLFYVPLSGAETPQPVMVDTDAILPPDAPAFSGQQLYLKSDGGNRGALYAATSTLEPARLADDIALEPAFTVENAGKTLLYYRRYDTDATPGRGDLYLYVKQERMIIGDVYSYDYRRDKLIYLTRSLTADGTFDIQLYMEGGVVTVDTGVGSVIAIQRDS